MCVCVGLLDQPVVVEGKRKRKATNQYNVGTTVAKKKVAIKHTGSGTKLQDIPSGIHTPSLIISYLLVLHSGAFIDRKVQS